ncbi:DUF4359 domain-containing protein [Anabaena sp. FACHB-1237]|uniref:DUF4359 domain-containing protein n=1 Tax=Anabaena sp. FACHB-1237 TaxID=2692769 RepID=UPI001681BE08|nr:DUF4359 domain-containing protein [Anabaena sp. FACHB-1237]MBD2137280.1 DUF4359 domain-containing protein [Anabaena sp. FACHB-1237]
MKPLTVVGLLGSASLAILGIVMFQTNPKQDSYENYTMQQLNTYLKTDVCQKTPNFLQSLVKVDCNELITRFNPQIKDLITSTTTRQDYIIFSVYRTEINVSSWIPGIPGYKFETLGAFNQFYTYSAVKQ